MTSAVYILSSFGETASEASFNKLRSQKKMVAGYHKNVIIANFKVALKSNRTIYYAAD